MEMEEGWVGWCGWGWVVRVGVCYLWGHQVGAKYKVTGFARGVLKTRRLEMCVYSAVGACVCV